MGLIIFILLKERELRSIGTLKNTCSLWKCFHLNSVPSRFLSLGYFLLKKWKKKKLKLKKKKEISYAGI